jgi:hypothetical protein
LLTLLSNSVMTGVTAFLFSTIVITLAGEIAPQAYFSRRALKIAAALSPVLRFYQYVLFIFAKPTAWVLDRWLGLEGIDFLREKQLTGVIEQHIESEEGEVDYIEGRGALNFLEIDDVPIRQEGERLDPSSVIDLPIQIDLPVLPEVVRRPDDPFLRRVHASGHRWVVLTDVDGEPLLVLDADAFLRAALVDDTPFDGYAHCHRPIVVRDAERPLGEVLAEFKSGLAADSDGAIPKDIVLLWTGEHRRIVTGADILGRLLRGIG